MNTPGRSAADGLRPAPARAVVGVDVRGLIIATRPALSVKHVGRGVLTADCACESKEPSMGTLDEARFEGVAFDDYRLSVSINRAFFKRARHLDQADARLNANRPNEKRVEDRCSPHQPGRTTDPFPPLLTTIVKNLRWLGEPFPGSTIEGHVLTIPTLGRVIFGEMFVSGPTRRVTMLRFELTGDVVFDGACCEIETGGNWRH